MFDFEHPKRQLVDTRLRTRRQSYIPSAYEFLFDRIARSELTDELLEKDYERALGTCRTGRGSLFTSRGKAVTISATGMSGELATTTLAGSTAWAQQPHVTQVGGHVPSARPDCSSPVHGSDSSKLDTPETLNVSNATMMVGARRRTTPIVAFRANARVRVKEYQRAYPQ